MDVPFILESWTAFICDSVKYFDDAITRLVDQQCQTLLQLLHQKVAIYLNGPKKGDGEQRIVDLTTALCDISGMAIAITPDLIRAKLSRSNSAQALKTSSIRSEASTKTSWTGMTARDLAERHAASIQDLKVIDQTFYAY